jgi:hypothetical protein
MAENYEYKEDFCFSEPAVSNLEKVFDDAA